MAVIKGKEKKMKKSIPSSKVRLNAESKRKLRRPQDCQPIPVVSV